MAKIIKPEPGIDRAIEIGIAYGKRPTPLSHLSPYEYGSPCYWAYTGAYKATVENNC